MRHLNSVSILAASALLGSTALAQELMVVDATNDRVLLVSAVDGTVTNPNFIALSGSTGSAPAVPIQAIATGTGEIWITDQGADTVFRWSEDGTTYLGEWGTGRDNIRGIHIDFGRVWVANFGTGGAGYGLALKEYSLATSFIAAHTFPGSPFGIISHNGELLVSDSTNDTLVRMDPATGAVLGVLHDSDGVTGIDFPGQLAKTQAGNILAAGLITPVGAFEYDANGVQLSYFDGTGVLSSAQGVHELLNGNILVGANNGLWVYDRTAVTWTAIIPGIDANYITPYSVGSSPPTVFCTAGTSTNGCVASISATAQPSASLATSCVINVASVEGQKSGLVFYGVDNSNFTPFSWGFGSSSFLCLKSPTQRMPSQSSGGTPNACDGSITQDWNAFQTAFPGSLGTPFSVGDKAYAQLWYRDPAAVKTTNLSDALELTFAP